MSRRPVRVLGLPIVTPRAVIDRALIDLGAISRVAQTAPVQLERLLEIGEEIVAIGRDVLEVFERLDERAETIMRLGERLEARVEAMTTLGHGLEDRAEQLLAMGATIEQLGQRMDLRGEEIVDRASRVAETGAELIAVLPAVERALDMATPLEGAIDRFGRLVDRLPGGATRRRPDTRGPRPPDPVAPQQDPSAGDGERERSWGSAGAGPPGAERA